MLTDALAWVLVPPTEWFMPTGKRAFPLLRSSTRWLS
jgi:hypothetical protein